MRGYFLCAVLTVAACKYDLDAISPRGRDAAVDQPVMMDMVPIDAMRPDVRIEVGIDMPTRPPSTGAWALATLENVMNSTNGVTVIEGTTVGANANIPAPTCAAVTASSTRTYRYTVVAGDRLIATTNTGRCNTHDTVLAAYFSYTGGTAVPAGFASCVDDDSQNFCTPCAGGDGGTVMNRMDGCSTVFSTVEVNNLIPGDVVYFTVGNFMGDSMTAPGAFRLSIAENGLRRRALEPTSTLTLAPHCSCTGVPPMMTNRSLTFPNATDSGTFTSASRAIFGTRMLPYTRIYGISGKINLRSSRLSSDPMCNVPGGSPLAALDVVIGNSVVASVTLDNGVIGSPFFTIPYTPTNAGPFSSMTPTLVQLQIRPFMPAATTCFLLDVDTSAQNAITLYSN
jgi:hypothetical protein